VDAGAGGAEGAGGGARVGLGPLLAACSGSVAFGFHVAAVNGCLGAMAGALGLAGAAQQGLVVSAVLLGAMGGSFVGGPLASVHGRRGALLLAALPLLAGPLLSASASSFGAMILGRLVAGAGIGLASTLVPLYVSEISPTACRGSRGSVVQVCICGGIVLALLANLALPGSWRAIFLLSALPGATLAAGMASCPESPQWLLGRGREAEAFAAAERLWGAEARAELGPHSGSFDGDDAAAPPERPRAGLLRDGVVLGGALFLLQQLSGINAIVYFSSDIFRAVGVPSEALASTVVGVVNLGGALLAVTFMDRFDRRGMLMRSWAAMGAAMAAMAWSASTLPATSPLGQAVAVCGTLVYILAFALGAGPMPALMVPELNRAADRDRAMTVAMGTHWASNVLVGQGFLAAVACAGVGPVYAGFAAVSFLAVAFVLCCVRETRGLSLQELEDAG